MYEEDHYEKCALIITLLLSLMFSACTTPISKSPLNLMDNIQESDLAPIGISNPEEKQLRRNKESTDFSLKLINETFEDNNILIYPLSIVSALGIVANGAKGNTLSEMERVLNSDIQGLNDYLKAYAAYLPKKVGQMRFVFPNKEYEQKAIEFIQEFRDNSSPINGTGGLDGFLERATYQDWLLKVEADRDIANIPENRVPAYTYFYIREDDDRIIGMINIRLALNDFLRKEGGHIGYCIRPTERRKGYGTRMLREALIFLEPIGLTDIILTCSKENVASAGVIKNCGGVLEDEFYSNVFNEVIQRYRICIV